MVKLYFQIILLLIIFITGFTKEFSSCTSHKDCDSDTEGCLTVALTSYCTKDCSIDGVECNQPYVCRELEDKTGEKKSMCAPAQ
uniref:ShKT domain-containing protein n=1 Tax=Parastrongyloides trichosuri TaxID=131310 RepID=A0A0N4ZHB1_PARTI